MPAILAAMPVPSLYLDASVLGGYFDDEWKDATQELWRQMEADQWRFYSSTIAVDELAQAPEHVRQLFDAAFASESLVAITPEIEQLAARYIA
jgi:hypothetical protein